MVFDLAITTYLSLGEIYGKIPQIWKRMADQDGNVNSNYGMAVGNVTEPT